MASGLRRVLAEPGRRLFGSGRERGAFTTRNAASQRAAELLVEHGLLEIDGERCSATPAGRAWLAEHDDPRLLLEDLLRASETQADSFRQLESLCRQQVERLSQQQTAIAAVLARVNAAVGAEVLVESAIAEILAEHRRSGNPADCSVAELYERLRQRRLHLTIGLFHDILRALCEAGRLRLAPWTGPLYQLPQPALALLIGHEVLYYVQPVAGSRAA